MSGLQIAVAKPMPPGNACLARLDHGVLEN
jgi:hypothetical protein